jgi:hypothetical protein
MGGTHRSTAGGTNMGFLWGVLSSSAAGVIIGISGWLGSRRLRRWLINWLSRLTGTGVVESYDTQLLANGPLADDLRTARWVRVFASRGNELTRESFADLWAGVEGGPTSVQILLPDPGIGGWDSWIDQRERELRVHDPGFVGGLLGRQVRANLDYLQSRVANRSDVEIRLYDFPHVGRIIATDRLVYLTTYTDSDHGRNSPCLVFRRPSAMYDFCVRIVDLAWSQARAAPAGHGRSPGSIEG